MGLSRYLEEGVRGGSKTQRGALPSNAPLVADHARRSVTMTTMVPPMLMAPVPMISMAGQIMRAMAPTTPMAPMAMPIGTVVHILDHISRLAGGDARGRNNGSCRCRAR